MVRRAPWACFDVGQAKSWRRGSESNRRTRLCRPLHDHSATPPKSSTQKGKAETSAFPGESGAGNEARTRDLNLGKVALYQLSYSRVCCLLLQAPSTQHPAA